MRAITVSSATLLLITSLAVVGCVPERNDITANNKEHTGPYEVLSKRVGDNGGTIVRVRIGQPSATDVVARDIVHQMVNVTRGGITIEFLGANDAENGQPIRTLHWPGEIEYRR